MRSTAPGICCWDMASLTMESRAARRESSGAWENAAVENNKATSSNIGKCFTSAVTLHDGGDAAQAEGYQRCPQIEKQALPSWCAIGPRRRNGFAGHLASWKGPLPGALFLPARLLYLSTENLLR